MKELNQKRMPLFPLLLGLFVALFVAFIASFMVGRFTGASPLEVIKILMNSILGDIFEPTWAKAAETVVLNLRLPRIIAAILVGAALPMAGATYQAIFANPMASPDTLGVSSGASLGAVLAILLGFTSFAIESTAFIFGCVAVLLVYVISVIMSKGKNMILYLILVGMVVSSLLSAILSILKYVCDPENELPAITFWLMGSFNKVTYSDINIYIIFFVLGAVPLFLLRWRMNLLSLSDVEARSIGENTNVLRTITIICATLLTASAIAITGGVGWVGLIIPHIARIVVGHDFKRVLPVSALMGSIFLLIMDNLARSLTGAEIPVGVLTSLVGAPIFFFILIRFRRNMLNDN